MSNRLNHSLGRGLALGVAIPITMLSLGMIAYSYNQSLGTIILLFGLVGWIPGFFYLKNKQFNGLNFLGNALLLFLFMLWHEMRDWWVGFFFVLFIVLVLSIPLEFLLKEKVPKVAWFILRFLILATALVLTAFTYGLLFIIPH